MAAIKKSSRPPRQTNSSNFWFALGREPFLSASELDAVLNLNGNFKLVGNILIAAADVEPALIGKLGGTVKIGAEIAAHVTEEELLERMTAELKNVSQSVNGKITFGLSFYGHPPLPMKTWGLRVKKDLTSSGLSARYAENKTPELSSVTVTKNNLLKRGAEFLIFGANGKFSLAKTIAVQPFAEFSARDYGRPGRDDASGMLPPKLAMMMINLARADKNEIILDPFCGSGTVLTEALLLGYDRVVGADISDQAVSDAEQNITWTIKDKKASVFQSDVADIDERVAAESVGAVVTEPYLGKPLRGNESDDLLRKQTDELKKLYLEAFGQFHKLLKKGGAVVFVIPRFQTRNGWLTIDCAREIKEIGFEPTPFFNKQNFLLYHRPGQRVAREIWRFVKR